jgi:hypothetical protein
VDDVRITIRAQGRDAVEAGILASRFPRPRPRSRRFRRMAKADPALATLIELL